MLWVLLTGIVGCSGSHPVPATVVTLGSSEEVTATGQQPSVLVSCEQGRISAYVVADPGDTLTGPRLVPIELDSAPGC